MIDIRYNSLLRRDAVRSEDVRIEIVKHHLSILPQDSPEKQQLENELAQLYNDRNTISDTIHEIASTVLKSNLGNDLDTVTKTRMKLTEHDCYKSVTQYIHQKCFDLQNEFVLNKLYIMANLCQIGLSDFDINQATDQVCKQRIHFNY